MHGEGNDDDDDIYCCKKCKTDEIIRLNKAASIVFMEHTVPAATSCLVASIKQRRGWRRRPFVNLGWLAFLFRSSPHTALRVASAFWCIGPSAH